MGRPGALHACHRAAEGRCPVSETYKEPFIPRWVDEAGLRPAPFRVWMHLRRRINHTTRRCFCSVRRIAGVCQLHKDTVCACIAELVQRGFVVRESGQADRRSNVYYLPSRVEIVRNEGTNPAAEVSETEGRSCPKRSDSAVRNGGTPIKDTPRKDTPKKDTPTIPSEGELPLLESTTQATAERQMGAFLKQMPKATGTREQLNGSKSGGAVVEPPERGAQTLAEIGITKKQSATAQKLADIPPVSAAERIYAAYPRRVAKKDALKAITEALKTTPEAKLIEATKAYAAAVAQWPASESRFIPHPATWFNSGRYDDDRVQWRRNSHDKHASAFS